MQPCFCTVLFCFFCEAPVTDLLPGLEVKETDATNNYSNKYYNCDILIHRSICGRPFVLCDVL